MLLGAIDVVPKLWKIVLAVAWAVVVRIGRYKIWIKFLENFSFSNVILIFSLKFFDFKRYFNVLKRLTFSLKGLDSTGFFMNPVLAASQIYGCIGMENWKHLAVYWVGPTLGWLIATKFYSNFKLLLNRLNRNRKRWNSRTTVDPLFRTMPRTIDINLMDWGDGFDIIDDEPLI